MRGLLRDTAAHHFLTLRGCRACAAAHTIAPPIPLAAKQPTRVRQFLTVVSHYGNEELLDSLCYCVSSLYPPAAMHRPNPCLGASGGEKRTTFYFTPR